MVSSIVCHLKVIKLSYNINEASLFKLKLPMQDFGEFSDWIKCRNWTIPNDVYMLSYEMQCQILRSSTQMVLLLGPCIIKICSNSGATCKIGSKLSDFVSR